MIIDRTILPLLFRTLFIDVNRIFLLSILASLKFNGDNQLEKHELKLYRLC